MKRGVLLLVIVVLGIVTPARGQKHPPTRKLAGTGTSSIRMINEGGDYGCRGTTIVNTRFLVSQAGEPGGMTYRERARVTKCYNSEGIDGDITLEAWPTGSSLMAKPLFVIHESGTRGEFTAEYSGGYYRVLQNGCCGPSDDWVYFSALTGKKLFVSSLNLLEFATPDKVGHVVALHDSYSASAIPERAHDSMVFGVLTWGDGAEPSRRVLIRGEEKCWMNSVQQLKLTYAGKSDSVSGVVTTLQSPADCLNGIVHIEIPIENGNLVLERATLPKGVTVEWSKAKP
jgi:hypothetical protein